MLLALLTSVSGAWGQKPLPVLRAGSAKLSIREGRFFYRDVWGVSSRTKPDVFTANRFSGRQRIVFYSDLDSLVFVVKPDRKYDFIVLLNARDSAYTQISTRVGSSPTLRPKLVYTSPRQQAIGADTLPFRLDKNFGIHLRGTINDSDSLDFLFDTGAGAVVVTAGLLGTKVHLKLDGSTGNVGTDGSSQVRTSSGNRLTVGGLVWQNASLLAVDYKGFAFEAVLGWVAFENKVVEIDYEKRRLIVRDNVGTLAADYSPVAMKLLNGIPYVQCSLAANGRESVGWFDLDTGSDGGLLVSQQFAAASNWANELKRIGSGQARGSTGGTVRQLVCALPKFKVGAYELYQLPLAINETDPPGGASAENIGSRVLRRFNWILDFKHNVAYNKPNRFLYSSLTESVGQ